MHLKKTELQTRVERRCWENVNTLEVVVQVNLWECGNSSSKEKVSRGKEDLSIT